MKKILLLLLFTVASYGQAVFDEGIQITGNANSATATKVNVQETDGKVNTQTIKTGFNKNIGLGGSDVVGANTLLNQYSTTPVDWTASAFSSGQVVFYAGKQWIAKIATVAGDVPAVSSKWGEITFEALANKTTTVDQTIIDGSTNAVAGNAVFDGLATKAPISSVHNPVTIGTANGLSLATQQLSLGLASSSTTGALSGTDWNNFNSKLNTPTGLTTNYLPKWNGSGFVDSATRDLGDGIFELFTPKGTSPVYRFTQNAWRTWDIGVKPSPSFPSFYIRDASSSIDRFIIADGGRVLINKTDDDLTNQLQVNGTISASPATTANQVPTWGQVQAAARPYKVYTANLFCSGGTNAGLSQIIGENTLGVGNPTISTVSQGTYDITFPSAIAPSTQKIFLFGQKSANQNIGLVQISTSVIRVTLDVNYGSITFLSSTSHAIEIRVIP